MKKNDDLENKKREFKNLKGSKDSSEGIKTILYTAGGSLIILTTVAAIFKLGKVMVKDLDEMGI